MYRDPLIPLGHQPHAPEKPVKSVLTHLSPAEKLIGGILVAVLLISGLTLIGQASSSFIEEVPASGGAFTEGIVGSPRFINPLLAISNADRDLSALIYAGLLKPTPEGLQPELAESYSISEDGLTYTFILRDDITFHDGTKVTADDVIFTISAVQTAALKSPRFANWEGVHVEKVSEREVIFQLEEAYAPFLENMTIGILPKHIWEHASIEEFAFSEFNISPIGAGPFRIDSIKRNDSGIPEEYVLERFSDYALKKPHIKNIFVRFYRNEEAALAAYTQGDIDSLSSVTPSAVTKLGLNEEAVLRSPLPRIFGVFFNKNRAEVFARQEVRAALNVLLDKQEIVNTVLSGYGSPIDSPIPLEVFPPEEGLPQLSIEERTAKATELLQAGGWEKGPDGIWKRESSEGTLVLSFSLSTTNTPELRDTAQHVARVWNEFGASVDVQIFEPTDLAQNVIRPRRYDALFFGEIVGRELDLFAFWHSSQRNDPGLNIALYTSITADALLKKVRTTTDPEVRMSAYKEFDEEIKQDVSAVFIYSPDFIYLAPKQVKNVSIDMAAMPSERFLNIEDWYIQTSHAWNIFK